MVKIVQVNLPPTAIVGDSVDITLILENNNLILTDKIQITMKGTNIPGNAATFTQLTIAPGKQMMGGFSFIMPLAPVTVYFDIASSLPLIAPQQTTSYVIVPKLGVNQPTIATGATTMTPGTQPGTTVTPQVQPGTTITTVVKTAGCTEGQIKTIPCPDDPTKAKIVTCVEGSWITTKDECTDDTVLVILVILVIVLFFALLGKK